MKTVKKKIKKIYNYKHVYKLINIASKLLNYRVNMTFFVRNYEIFFGLFEENDKQIPQKSNIYCKCETILSYFSKQ